MGYDFSVISSQGSETVGRTSCGGAYKDHSIGQEGSSQQRKKERKKEREEEINREEKERRMKEKRKKSEREREKETKKSEVGEKGLSKSQSWKCVCAKEGSSIKNLDLVHGHF